jgi:serine/threonine protein kinase
MNNDTLLNDRYEIEEILGQGGFATMYLAVDTETHYPQARTTNVTASISMPAKMDAGSEC